MSKRSNRVLLAILSLIIVALVISTALLVSVVQMGQFTKLASNEKVTVASFGKAVRYLQVKYAGYLTLTYNASAPVDLTIAYSYAGHNFTSTYLGTGSEIHLSVLPSDLKVTFYAAFESSTIIYSAMLEY
jgi:ABC-type antimicrobial peptide transport system permease subunit